MLRKKFIAAAAAITLLAGSMPPGAVRAADNADTGGNDQGEIYVNPDLHYQTLEGWGTSLCWWGNIIGEWGNQDFNENGRPDREEIAELAFSPEYLNLNVVRYNVGGGDDPAHTHMKRCEGAVPGWTKDMTGTEDGSGEFMEEQFFGKNSEDMQDFGQIWMLEQANRYRKETAEKNGTENDVINKVFSNSPPYYMTNSGCSTGNTSSGKDNLKSDKFDEFATYMTRAAKWLDKDLNKKFGVSVDYIEPMNEPDSTWWGANSTKQEGCHFNSGATQISMIKAQKKALTENNMDKVKITGTDEWAVGYNGNGGAVESWNLLDDASRALISTISAHTYSGSSDDRRQLRDIAASQDKGLWMSEVCMGADGHDPYDMDKTAAFSLSGGILNDLRNMQNTAWIAWLVGDSEYECLQTNSNWGLLHVVFEKDGPVPDYHKNLVNADGSKKDGVPDQGYYEITKQFYTLMQYSKYLKAGYTLVDIGDDNMVAAVSPDRRELVVVAQNSSGNARSTSLDLSKFTGAESAEVIRTSNSENAKKLESQKVTDGVLSMKLPAKSITTYVVRAEGGKALYNEAGYGRMVNSEVVYNTASANAGADNVDKFTYTGTWNKVSEGGSYSGDVKKTTDSSASAQFTFKGDRAVIYGSRTENGAVLSVSVDEKAPTEADTSSDKAKSKAVIFDTGKLEGSGTHTVQISMASGQTVGTPEISLDAAQIITGDPDVTEAPRITRIVPHDKALRVIFEGTSAADSYEVRYGTSSDPSAWKESDVVTVHDTEAVLKNLNNGTAYYVQVSAAGGQSGSSVKKGTPKAAANKDIYYFVNAGMKDNFLLNAGEQFGTMNSSLEQTYGQDPVTGKLWGYEDGNGLSGGNDGTDKWSSVRTDDQNTVNKGLTYKFELEPGEYMVTMGFKDPWNNAGRKQDIVVQGKTVETAMIPNKQIQRTYKAEVTTEQNRMLTVEILRNQNNTGGNEDPLVNFILVEKYNGSVVTEVLPVEDMTGITGAVPVLPSKVDVKTLGGETVQKNVSWNYDDKTFSDKEFETVTVQGTVDDTDLEASVKVELLPDNLIYFADCNNSSSPYYHKVKAASKGLRNEAPDQAYSEGSWGFMDSYGVMNNDSMDKFAVGWYAKGGQNIDYTFPLEAGKYKIYLGAAEWWNQNRPMKAVITRKAGEQANETLISDLGVSGNKKIKKSGTITTDKQGDTTFSVQKTGDSDPVLSWAAIQQQCNLESLLKAMEQAAGYKKADYTPDSWAVFEQALQAANDVMSDTSGQDAADKAAADLTAAMSKLAKKADLKAINNLINKAQKLNASDYTAATFKKVRTALANAQKTAADQNASQAAVDKAASALQVAINGLKKPDTSKPGTDEPSKPEDGSTGNNSGSGDRPSGGNSGSAGQNDSGNVTVTNEEFEISVTGALKAGTVLTVSEVEEGEEYNAIKNKLPSDIDKFVVLDLSLMRNNIKVQPDGTIMVTIPVPDGLKGDLAVFRTEKDGSLTRLPCQVKDGKLTFKTDHFSLYTIGMVKAAVKENESGKNTANVSSAETGDKTPTGAYFILLAMALTAGTASAVFVMRRKRCSN